MSALWLALGAAALFGALALLALVALTPGVPRRRLATELGARSGQERSHLSALGARAVALTERALARRARDRMVAAALERAGIDLRPPEFVLLAVCSALAGAFVGLAVGGVGPALVFAGAVIAGFVGVVRWKIHRRQQAFAEQLPDTLVLLTSGLRAGHSLPQAVDAIVTESLPPTSEEFRRVLFETQLGHSLPEAMGALAERMHSEDLGWVVEAIEIQGTVGGDLAELLENVNRTIRDRNRVRRQIDTLTAEGKLSAVVLFLLPLAMFAFMTIANPAYIGELTSSLFGIVLLAVGAGLMVAGGFWLRRIVRLVY